MKYAYDKGFKKVAVSLPFFGFLCKKAQRPMEKMLNKMEIPGKVSVRDFKIKGFKGEDIVVKEITPLITPLKTSDTAILVLHGGGFGYKMAPYQFHNACRYADELGCKVFVPDYHLIPDFPFPAAYEDAMLTYQYMVEGAQELEINPDRIMVLGDSAGGALAANVCNTAHAKGLPRQTVNSALKKLEKDGYLTLRRIDGKMGKSIHLTEKGEEFVAKNIAPVMHAEEKACALFSEEEKEMFLSVFHSLVERLNEEISNVHTEG